MTEKNKAKNKNELKFVVGTRGRTFEGTVVKKFDRRAVVEFDRTVKIAKYERFMRKTTRIHSRIPDGLEVNVGDYVKVQECRPLSKMIHSIVIEVIRHAPVMEAKAK
ncbi:MAG: 30S ribosomal protein S17 [Nanoarchaeota archaeon]